jgi:transcriptional regulator with XRE-family HTH domain
MTNEGFAKRLKQLRLQKNFSQSELGEKVGVHYTHIGHYEKGHSMPKTQTLQLLAEALGVTSDYLIEGQINEVAKTKLEDRDLLAMFTEVEQFVDEDKLMVKKILDALITKRKIQNLAK